MLHDIDCLQRHRSQLLEAGLPAFLSIVTMDRDVPPRRKRTQKSAEQAFVTKSAKILSASSRDLEQRRPAPVICRVFVAVCGANPDHMAPEGSSDRKLDPVRMRKWIRQCTCAAGACCASHACSKPDACRPFPFVAQLPSEGPFAPPKAAGDAMHIHPHVVFSHSV